MIFKKKTGFLLVLILLTVLGGVPGSGSGVSQRAGAFSDRYDPVRGGGTAGV